MLFRVTALSVVALDGAGRVGLLRDLSHDYSQGLRYLSILQTSCPTGRLPLTLVWSPSSGFELESVLL